MEFTELWEFVLDNGGDLTDEQRAQLIVQLADDYEEHRGNLIHELYEFRQTVKHQERAFADLVKRTALAITK